MSSSIPLIEGNPGLLGRARMSWETLCDNLDRVEAKQKRVRASRARRKGLKPEVQPEPNASINGQEVHAIFDRTCDTITGPFGQVWNMLESIRGVTVKFISKPEQMVYATIDSDSDLPKIHIQHDGKSYFLTDEASFRVRDGQKICSIVGKLSATHWTFGRPFFQSGGVTSDRGEEHRIGVSSSPSS